MRACHVTYEIFTEESVQHADAAERGFVLANGEHVELLGDVFGAAAGAIKNQCGLSLREAIDLIGCVEGDGPYYETDGSENYRTGEHTRQALHLPDSLTAASAARVEKILRKRRLLVR